MIDRVSAEAARNYQPFLIRGMRVLNRLGVRPFFLIHEGEQDTRIAEQCNERSGLSLQIVREAASLAANTGHQWSIHSLA